MRIPYAARQLIAEVRNIEPDAVTTYAAPPDGYGVWRSIAFDASTSQWLEPALRAVQDDRIVSLDMDDHGLIVVFSAGIDADEAYEFNVRSADRVLRGD